ncbi:MAG TPA: hypothetical protein VJ810_15270 [Blastocatellia bacterium]|nr:hypothetical protein [Blastocatellia bacterium]
MIGPQHGEAPPDEISGAVFLLYDLRVDLKALEVIFSRGLFFK